MTECKRAPHISIMVDEVLSYFKDCHLNVFVEGTLGAGGHAKEILKAHPEIKTYIGFDQDPYALQIAQKELEPWKEKVHFIHDNFSHMEQHLSRLNIKKVDGFFLT